LDALAPHAAQYGQLTPRASAASRPVNCNALIFPRSALEE
jgi:hypothetical protein